MKGWRIFTHSAGLVLNNLGDALRISLVLYMAQVVNQLVVATATYTPVEGTGMAMPDNPGTLLLTNIATLLASLWIAVAWHRFALTGERAAGWLPVWQGARMLGYFGRSLLIGLMVALGLMVAGLFLGVLALAVPGAQALLLSSMAGLAAYLFFRLGVMLPAAALGRNLTLAESWRATKDKDGAVVVLALIAMGASLLVQAPSWLNPDPGSVVNIVYQLVTGWFVTLIGVSVLTTLYGHYVEGRPID